MNSRRINKNFMTMSFTLKKIFKLKLNEISLFALCFWLIFLPGAYAIAGQICTTAVIGPNDFEGISGSSDSNVIAVGDNGDIYQYNGTSWSAMTSPTTEDLRDVVVVGSSIAFAVGKNAEILQWNGTTWSLTTAGTEDFRTVWADSSSSVWAGGKNGTLYAYNGTTWTDQSVAAGTNSNKDIEGSWGDANSFFALDEDGALYEYNRNTTTWQAPDTLCNQPGKPYKDMWGDGSGNLYLVGKNGIIYKHNGTTCTLVSTASDDLEGIYGSGPNDIYAVGKNGIVMHYDGVSWTETTEGTEDLKDVWISSGKNAYYAGKNGQSSTCTFTTTTCSTQTIGAKDLNGISGSSDSNVIAVGKRDSGLGQIWEYDGTTWTRNNDVDIPNEDLKDVEVLNTTTAFAVGNKGGGRGTFLVNNSGNWSDESSNLPAINVDMLGVWSDTATEVFIGGKRKGNDGTFIRCTDSGSWSCVSLLNNSNDNSNQDIEDVWGDSNDVYFLGKRGRLFIFDRSLSGNPDPANAANWTEETACKDLTGNSDFRDLWGDGAGNIYLTGKGKATGSNLATVWKYDGSTCSVVHETATENDMKGGIYGSTVTGDIYAGGKNGLVIFSNDNGATWSETIEGSGEDIKDVWVSDSGNVYYAAKGGDVTTCIDTTSVDHYAISYPLGIPGVTCEALAVRITAHGDATDHSIIVAPSNATIITLSTTPAADGWTLKSGNGIFTGPNLYTFDGTETFAEFWLTETTATTAPHIDIDVTDGTATDIDGNATEDAKIEFADAVFRFFAGGTGESIGTQIAGKESDIAPGNQTIQLRSVVTNTSTMACESRILNTQTIEMAYKCNNPTTCQGTPRLQIENAAAATFDITPGNANASTVDATTGSYDNVDLDFAATGTATFSFDFNDVGQIQLFAREVLAAVSPDPAITVFGTSNMFIVRPFAFDIDSAGLRAADWLDNSALDDSTSSNISYAADANGSVFAAAGHSTNTFPVTLRSVVWESADDGDNDGVPNSGVNLTGNATTPNFGQETSSSELVDVTSSNVQPTNVGSLFFGSNLDFANGTITTNLAFDQVGIIDLTAALDTGDYLGGGSDVTATHQNFGRFKPDRFTLADNTPTLENGCVAGSFTYMEQSFYYATEPAITVTAVNEAGGTTVNYGHVGGTSATDYWKLPTALARSYDDNNINNGTSFSSLAAATASVSGHDNYDGIGILTISNTALDRDSFMFDRSTVDINSLAAAPAAPGTFEGTPFTASVDLLVRVTAGSLTDTDGVCYDGDGDGTCETDGSDDYTALTDTGGTALSLNQLRFGRFNIGTVVGSELLTLSPPLIVEYFNGTGFVANTSDTCSAIVQADHIRLDNTGTLVQGTATMTIGVGTTSITTFNSPLLTGDTGTIFSAPAAGNTGFVNIFGNLGCNDVTVACGMGAATFNYLRYDWDDVVEGDGPYDDEPSGRVDFGIFEGPRSFIYIREPW